jgi:hypothetical protein
LREVALQQTQYRQGLHDVPQRTGFEDENFHVKARRPQARASRSYLPKASRSARRGGNPASRIFF